MDRVEFKRSVRQGSVLRFDVSRIRVGRTSLQYRVTVFSDDLDSGQEEQVFSTNVTFVRLDGAGNKTRLPADCLTERQ